MDSSKEGRIPNLGSCSTKQKGCFGVLLALVAASLIITAVSITHHIRYRSDLIRSAKQDLAALTEKAAEEIETILSEVVRRADAIADDLTTQKLAGEGAMKARLKRTIEGTPHFYGGTITYRPYGYDPGRRLYAPYYSRSGQDGGLEFVYLEESYDYTAEKADTQWYRKPMQTGSRWTEPYWCKAGQTSMVTYSSVFYEIDPPTGQKTPLGVVTIDISMHRIRTLIESLDLGPSGFGALVSPEMVYLYHPNHEYVVSQKSVFDIAEECKDKDRFLMAKMAGEGKGGILDHVSTTTGKPSWLVFQPVPSVGWSLQNTFLKSDIPIDVDVLRRQLFWITLAALIFALALLALAFRVYTGEVKNIWIVAMAGSVLVVLGIGALWKIALTYNPQEKIPGICISDKVTLHNEMKKHAALWENKQLESPVLFLPTGILIESIKFSGPSDVLLSGYIWQTYAKDFPNAIKRKFSISKANNIKIQEVNRHARKGATVIRWYFEAEIRQEFTHRKYPIEQERIGLRIIHRELNPNIVLTPDLDAYSLFNASLLPGLDKGTFISGWKLMRSYYELRIRDLNTNFGLEPADEKEGVTENYPALYYNIIIQRNFIDAFISNLTPLIIVSVLLFFLLLLSEIVDAVKVFSICVAMFFVIVFSHIDIRSKICAQEIFYLEYFYFLTYGATLYVTLNAIAILIDANLRQERRADHLTERRQAGRERVNLLYREKNLIGRTLFWPVFWGVIFVVTMTTFY